MFFSWWNQRTFDQQNNLIGCIKVGYHSFMHISVRRNNICFIKIILIPDIKEYRWNKVCTADYLSQLNSSYCQEVLMYVWRRRLHWYVVCLQIVIYAWLRWWWWDMITELFLTCQCYIVVASVSISSLIPLHLTLYYKIYDFDKTNLYYILF